MLPRFSALGQGDTVLMLHGIGGGHDAFAPQLGALAEAGYRAVSWDAPGYGASAPVEPYTFKALAESAIGLIEALQPSQNNAPLVLVGHSMGGMVAQEVVLRRPDLVRGLVLAGTSSAFGKRSANGDPAEFDQWSAKFLAERTAPLDAGLSMQQLAEQLVPAMVGPASSPEGAALAVRVMAQVPQATYRRALQCLPTFDRAANLAQITAPTLFIAGEFDRNSPSSLMQRMHQQLPSSSWALMKNIGHLMPLEAPEEFSRLLLHFMRHVLGESR